jgi:hypothetical protein
MACDRLAVEEKQGRRFDPILDREVRVAHHTREERV